MSPVDVEHRRNLPLLNALTYERLIPPTAQSQRERIQEDRLSGAGLTGKNGKTPGKIDVEPVDQYDVTDRESGKHRRPVQEPMDSPSLKSRMAGTRLVRGPAKLL